MESSQTRHGPEYLRDQITIEQIDQMSICSRMVISPSEIESLIRSVFVSEAEETDISIETDDTLDADGTLSSAEIDYLMSVYCNTCETCFREFTVISRTNRNEVSRFMDTIDDVSRYWALLYIKGVTPERYVIRLNDGYLRGILELDAFDYGLYGENTSIERSPRLSELLSDHIMPEEIKDFVQNHELHYMCATQVLELLMNQEKRDEYRMIMDAGSGDYASPAFDGIDGWYYTSLQRAREFAPHINILIGELLSIRDEHIDIDPVWMDLISETRILCSNYFVLGAIDYLYSPLNQLLIMVSHLVTKMRRIIYYNDQVILGLLVDRHEPSYQDFIRSWTHTRSNLPFAIWLNSQVLTTVRIRSRVIYARLKH